MLYSHENQDAYVYSLDSSCAVPAPRAPAEQTPSKAKVTAAETQQPQVPVPQPDADENPVTVKSPDSKHVTFVEAQNSPKNESPQESGSQPWSILKRSSGKTNSKDAAQRTNTNPTKRIADEQASQPEEKKTKQSEKPLVKADETKTPIAPKLQPKKANASNAEPSAKKKSQQKRFAKRAQEKRAASGLEVKPHPTFGILIKSASVSAPGNKKDADGKNVADGTTTPDSTSVKEQTATSVIDEVKKAAAAPTPATSNEANTMIPPRLPNTLDNSSTIKPTQAQAQIHTSCTTSPESNPEDSTSPSASVSVSIISCQAAESAATLQA